MNIKSRIKSLENQIGVVSPNSEFCQCFNNHFQRTLDKVYNGAEYEGTDDLLPTGDYCDACQKPVKKLDLDMQAKIILVYGSGLEYVTCAANPGEYLKGKQDEHQITIN